MTTTGRIFSAAASICTALAFATPASASTVADQATRVRKALRAPRPERQFAEQHLHAALRNRLVISEHNQLHLASSQREQEVSVAGRTVRYRANGLSGSVAYDLPYNRGSRSFFAMPAGRRDGEPVRFSISMSETFTLPAGASVEVIRERVNAMHFLNPGARGAVVYELQNLEVGKRRELSGVEVTRSASGYSVSKTLLYAQNRVEAQHALDALLMAELGPEAFAEAQHDQLLARAPTRMRGLVSWAFGARDYLFSHGSQLPLSIEIGTRYNSGDMLFPNLVRNEGAHASTSSFDYGGYQTVAGGARGNQLYHGHQAHEFDNHDGPSGHRAVVEFTAGGMVNRALLVSGTHSSLTSHGTPPFRAVVLARFSPDQPPPDHDLPFLTAGERGLLAEALPRARAGDYNWREQITPDLELRRTGYADGSVILYKTKRGDADAMNRFARRVLGHELRKLAREPVAALAP